MFENGVSHSDDITAVLMALGGTLMAAAGGLALVIAWTSPADAWVFAATL